MSLEKLYFHKYSDNELSILMSDLSKNENLNVKNLLDNFEQQEKDKLKKKKKQSGKAKKIIEANKEKKLKQLESDDMDKLSYYKDLSVINNDTIGDIKLFQTEFGKNRLKYKLLERSYRTENMESTIELYLQIIDIKPETKHEQRFRDKIEKKLQEFNYKEFQFESLSNRLPPLDFYNDYEKKLEPWQLSILKQIKYNKDILIVAKTSMGKTWLAMYPGLLGKKTLFIVPTKPLAYQVASTFIKFLGGKTGLIVKDITNISENDTIIVGTPKEIEDNLSYLNFDFETIVCDEIHNISNYDGDCYERLIKLFIPKSQFIALSATIGNPEEVKDWFGKISGRPVLLEMHSARFLNLQRQLWINNKLERLHPFSCLEIDDINEDFLSSNIPFTPYDNIQVYKKLHEYFGDSVEHLNLNNVFLGNNKRLSLDDSKLYEDLLKKELLKIKVENPEKLSKLLDNFKREVIIEDEVNLYNLVNTIKNNNLSPCIIFQNDTNYCKEIFNKIVYYLQKLETLNYPYHYENLEFYQELFLEYKKKLNTFTANIKLGSTVKNKEETKDQMIKDFKKKELEAYCHKILVKFEKQKVRINKSEYNQKIKSIQLKNLDTEIQKVLNNNSIKKYDVFEKHIDFSLSKDQPMSAEQIRQIRKKISNQLNISVDYNNTFIQGLKRGIGIYTSELPEIYNQIVQSLAQNGDLEFVVSDKTLALGINMPFRSSCILGYKDNIEFSKNDYEQMIGRSGRRGKDDEGHVIYANVNWKNLMKGNMGIISGQDKILNKYNVLSDISNWTLDQTNNIYENFINKNVLVDKSKITKIFSHDILEKNIIWSLRYYENQINIWLKYHDIFDMEFKKSKFNKIDLIKLFEIVLAIFIDNCEKIDLKNINLCVNTQNILNQYKKSSLENCEKEIYLIADIIKLLYNNYINSEYYINLKKIMRDLFENLLELINKNQCLSK